MGLIEELGKSFIRSAVNQIGRDAGKVVSNQVYGDAHSTPHRVVGNKKIIDNEYIDTIAKSEFTEKEEPHSTFGMVVRIVLASMFTFLGGILLIVYGRKKKSNASLTAVYKYESVPTYEEDRRYKSGKRYAGDITIRRKYYMQADSETEQKNLHVANIYIWCGVAIVVFNLVVFTIIAMSN